MSLFSLEKKQQHDDVGISSNMKKKQDPTDLMSAVRKLCTIESRL